MGKGGVYLYVSIEKGGYLFWRWIVFCRVIYSSIVNSDQGR